jgi:capsular polysaccharide biosynthesis protein
VPRTVGPLEAFVRRPLITLLPVLLLVGAAVYVGLARTPVYTAQARVNVGRTDVAPYVLQSVIGGNQALAVSYARVIAAHSVVKAAGRDAGTGTRAAASRLSASPVPGSTLIQVEATGPRTGDAVALANAGSRALISYVEKATRDTTSNGALSRFRAAQADMTRIQRKVNSLQAKGPKRASDLARAQVDLEAAKLRASNLANVYRASAADPSSGSPLTLIAPAASASSDFASTLERLVLLGVAAGLVLGLGLALLAANRGRLRAMRE